MCIRDSTSRGYAFGNSTLLREVRRQPWLSQTSTNGTVSESFIPPHGLLGGSAKQIGGRLFELMCEEAETVCKDRERIYILLSGGLDSRVVAGVIKHLSDQKRIDCKIEAVTWGLSGCRDVAYGKIVAERLDFDWHLSLIHI